MIQLSWFLGTLHRGNKFIYIPEKCILATGGNTGGYEVLKVFGENFPSIVRDQFGASSTIARAINFRNSIGYLPNLAWTIRSWKGGNFTKKQSSLSDDRSKKDPTGYHIIKAVREWPWIFSIVVRYTLSIWDKYLHACDRIREILYQTEENKI